VRGQMVVVEDCAPVMVAAQLVDQHLPVEVVAAFAGLDDQPGDAPLEKRRYQAYVTNRLGAL